MLCRSFPSSPRPFQIKLPLCLPKHQHHILMSFLTAAKHILKRPTSFSVFAVGITFLVWYFLADPLYAKPAVSRKMHIESIPMCE